MSRFLGLVCFVIIGWGLSAVHRENTEAVRASFLPITARVITTMDVERVCWRTLHEWLKNDTITSDDAVPCWEHFILIETDMTLFGHLTDELFLGRDRRPYQTEFHEGHYYRLWYNACRGPTCLSSTRLLLTQPPEWSPLPFWVGWTLVCGIAMILWKAIVQRVRAY